MKELGLLFLAILLSALLGLLGVKVAMVVGSLYGLTMITNLGFLKLYGLFSIVHLVMYKYTSETLETKEIYKRMAIKALFYLVFLGFSYLMFYIISL